MVERILKTLFKRDNFLGTDGSGSYSIDEGSDEGVSVSRRRFLEICGVAGAYFLLNISGLRSCSVFDNSSEAPPYLKMDMSRFPSDEEIQKMEEEEFRETLKRLSLSQEEFGLFFAADMRDDQIKAILGTKIAPSLFLIAKWLEGKQLFLQDQDLGSFVDILKPLIQKGWPETSQSLLNIPKFNEFFSSTITNGWLAEPPKEESPYYDYFLIAICYSLLQTIGLARLAENNSYYQEKKDYSALTTMMWLGLTAKITPPSLVLDQETKINARDFLLWATVFAFNYYQPISLNDEKIRAESIENEIEELIKESESITDYNQWEDFLLKRVRPVVVDYYTYQVEDVEVKRIIENIVDSYIGDILSQSSTGYRRLVPDQIRGVRVKYNVSNPNIIYITIPGEEPIELDLTEYGLNVGDFFTVPTEWQQATNVAFPFFKWAGVVRDPKGKLHLALIFSHTFQRMGNDCQNVLITLPGSSLTIGSRVIESELGSDSLPICFSERVVGFKSIGGLPEGWKEVIYVERRDRPSVVVGNLREINGIIVGDFNPTQATAEFLISVLKGLNPEKLDPFLANFGSRTEFNYFQTATTKAATDVYIGEIGLFGQLTDLQLVGQLEGGTSVPIYMFGGIKELGSSALIPGIQRVPGKTYVVIGGEFGKNRVLVIEVDNLVIEQTRSPFLAIANSYFLWAIWAASRTYPTGGEIKIVIDPLEGVDPEVKAMLRLRMEILQEEITKGFIETWFGATDEPIPIPLSSTDIEMRQAALNELKAVTQKLKITTHLPSQLGALTGSSPREIAVEFLLNAPKFMVQQLIWLIAAQLFFSFIQRGGVAPRFEVASQFSNEEIEGNTAVEIREIEYTR